MTLEREILIAAAPEKVWPLVAEPGFWATDDETVRGALAEEGQTLVVKDHTAGWEQCLPALAARAG